MENTTVLDRDKFVVNLTKFRQICAQMWQELKMQVIHDTLSTLTSLNFFDIFFSFISKPFVDKIAKLVMNYFSYHLCKCSRKITTQKCQHKGRISKTLHMGPHQSKHIDLKVTPVVCILKWLYYHSLKKSLPSAWHQSWLLTVLCMFKCD